jgi:benzoyl-CoA reductase/2-hydroxyglutaryl-CoA dehydratase subunit BcrC/BadD/HgdB
VVVADRYCWGALPGLDPIKVEGDPYINLAEHYLEICQCPRMMERYKDRINYLLQLVNDYKIDGVIYENMKFCELWGFEMLTALDGLRKAGVQVVKLDREYSLSGEGQLRTRVQAFLETIQGKRENAALGN